MAAGFDDRIGSFNPDSRRKLAPSTFTWKMRPGQPGSQDPAGWVRQDWHRWLRDRQRDNCSIRNREIWKRRGWKFGLRWCLSQGNRIFLSTI
jgi:hypothetical protein